MTILLIAEHDNQSLSDQTAKTLSAALKIGSDVHVLVAGKGAKAAADAAAKLGGVSKVLLAEADELEQRLAEPLAALIVALAGGYDTIIAPATTSGKNVMPRVAALLDVMQVSEIIEVISARHVQAADLCRQRDADRAVERRQEGDHRAHRRLPGSARRRLGVGRDGQRGGQSGPLDLRREPAVGATTAPSSPRPGSSFPAAARWALRRNSRRSSCRSPTSSAPRSAPRAPRSTPATRRTTGRSARPARWWRPTSTSPSAFPAPSSTSPA